MNTKFKIQKLQIQNFDGMDFFLKLSAAQLSFLHTAQVGTEERWSILAWNPSASVTTWEELRTLHIERQKSAASNEWNLPFCGGGIGSIPFGMGAEPKVHFYDEFLCFDHLSGTLYSSNPRFVEEVWARPLPRNTLSQNSPLLPLKPSWSKENYLKAFDRIKDYILDGEIYQVNLTQELSCPFEGDLKQVFQRLCSKNPAPLASYLEDDDFHVLSASPERFISLKAGTLTTQPIKGTRPRGKTPEEDESMKRDLLNSEKETAELNMITDLLRNDLGQVASTGTVHVLSHQNIQVCPTVLHTYSVIQAKLLPDLNGVDVLKACLPGGSISGCPKKRACEIIQELEPKPRGLYTGSLFYLSDDGNMDSSILIRTLIHQKNTFHLGVGGGIVADSTGESEYQETFQKALSFLEL